MFTQEKILPYGCLFCPPLCLAPERMFCFSGVVNALCVAKDREKITFLDWLQDGGRWMTALVSIREHISVTLSYKHLSLSLQVGP